MCLPESAEEAADQVGGVPQPVVRKAKLEVAIDVLLQSDRGVGVAPTRLALVSVPLHPLRSPVQSKSLPCFGLPRLRMTWQRGPLGSGAFSVGASQSVTCERQDFF